MRPIAERFYEKVQRAGPDDCWPWTGRTNKDGYGVFAVGHDGKVLAHRQAWQLEHGQIPEGVNVLHKCDNPPCCNERHLFLGTQIDNLQDMKAKGRARNQHSGQERTNTCGHPDRPHVAHGKCKACYMRAYHDQRGRETACA